MTKNATASSTRTASHRRAAPSPAPGQVREAEPAPSLTGEERRRMIQEVAYSSYAQRGYAHGHDFEDWLVAEARVDAILSGQGKSIGTPEPGLQQSGGRSRLRDETMKRILKQHPQRDVPKI